MGDSMGSLGVLRELRAMGAWPGAKNSIIAFAETIDGCLMRKT